MNPGDPTDPIEPNENDMTPTPLPPQSGFGKTAGAVGMELGDWQLFLRRSLRSDFYRERATDAERDRLAGSANPITTRLAQDYAAWRRGMLWMTAVAISVTLIFGVINTVSTLGERDIPGVFKFMTFALFGFQVGAAILVGLAALAWDDLPKSRQFSRFAWMLIFFGPFIVYLLPVGVLASDIREEQEYIAALMTVFVAGALFPSVIALFAGIIRASLTLKTLLPESSTPGWVALITAPLYALFFLIALIVAIQSTISWWLVVSLNAFLLAPILLLMRMPTLVQSHTPEEGHKIVQQVRRSNAVCMVVALVFFTIFATTVDMDISFWDLLSALFTFLASVLLLTMVMSDFMLSLLIQSFAQGKKFRDSEMEATLGTHYDELSESGLGDLDMGEADLFRSIGGAAKAAGRRSKEWVAADDIPTTPGPEDIPTTPGPVVQKKPATGSELDKKDIPGEPSADKPGDKPDQS